MKAPCLLGFLTGENLGKFHLNKIYLLSLYLQAVMGYRINQDTEQRGRIEMLFFLFLVILVYLDALVSHIVPHKRRLCPTSCEL
jgi:hypothetical protein